MNVSHDYLDPLLLEMELTEAKEDLKGLKATVMDLSSAVGKVLETQEIIQQSISDIWAHLGMLSQQCRPLPIYQGPFLPAPEPSFSTPDRNAVPRPCSSRMPLTPTNLQFASMEEQASPPNITPPQPLPLKTSSSAAKCLQSSEISTEGLRPVDEVILLNAKYRALNKASTLAVKLAREAIFGDGILYRCTISGERGFPGLPQKELQDLKRIILQQFPQFWQAPIEFEPTWRSCCEAIGQACKRLRDKAKE